MKYAQQHLIVAEFVNGSGRFIGGGSPVCVRPVLGNDHLQLAEAAHGRSVCAGGELQKEALLLLTERVQRLPKLPSE